MRILLATDGSPGSKKAAEFLARLPGVKEAAEVTVFHVVEPVQEYTYVGGVPLPIPVTDLDDPQVQERAKPVLEAAQAALAALPPDRVLTRLAVGEPAPVMVEYAREHGFDLIVVGSRGLSLFKELVLGSVSLQVLHSAHCPVMVVR